MANALTGDFDVVAEFSVATVNRILAAMHQCERFLHSVSAAVDDAPPPPHLQGTLPVLTGGVDTFGDPIVEPRRISGLRPQSLGALAANDPAFSILGGIVNPNFGDGVIDPGKTIPSNLKGKVQLQLSPPTVDVPDATGKNLTVTMNAMARYFPDKNTAPIAEFIRGDLRITAPVNQITSEVGNVAEFDFKADQAVISFTPSFSSTPLSASDIAAIQLVIRNALKTSFLPSSASLPPNIAQVQFKTFMGGQNAVAVLLNMSSHASNPASANNIFLGANDQFAFAAGRDFVLAALKPVTDNLLSQPLPPVTFTVWLGKTLHYSYPVTLKTASFDLQPGKIVLTITGHAAHSNHKIGGPFDFTVTLDFTLQAVGPTVKLIPGNVSLDTTSLVEELVSVFSDAATKSIANARDQALNNSGAFELVSDMFDMNQRLGPFLNSLLKDPSSNEPPPLQGFLMTYSGVDIQPAGIVLHGLLFLIFQLPDPQVEFEQIISTSGSGGIVGGLGNDGPDYSALKSWVPGGRIDQYEWSVKYQNKLYPFGVDPNKFVLLHSGPVATAGNGGGGSLPPYTPLCLTVRGTQLSPQGAIVPQAVNATVCGYTRVVTLPPGTLAEAQPTLALTQPSPDGHVVVTGHAAAQAASVGGAAPNVIVHFADAKSATQLEQLTQAVTKRKDVATAVVAVVPPDQLAKTRYNPGVIYADDRDGAWEKTFGAKSAHRPLTLLVTPKGEIVWKHNGPLERGTLGDRAGQTPGAHR